MMRLKHKKIEFQQKKMKKKKETTREQKIDKKPFYQTIQSERHKKLIGFFTFYLARCFFRTRNSCHSSHSMLAENYTLLSVSGELLSKDKIPCFHAILSSFNTLAPKFGVLTHSYTSSVPKLETIFIILNRLCCFSSLFHSLCSSYLHTLSLSFYNRGVEKFKVVASHSNKYRFVVYT